eukprot:515619-Pleurochrysis_carterae.AAC.1
MFILPYPSNFALLKADIRTQPHSYRTLRLSVSNLPMHTYSSSIFLRQCADLKDPRSFLIALAPPPHLSFPSLNPRLAAGCAAAFCRQHEHIRG